MKKTIAFLTAVMIAVNVMADTVEYVDLGLPSGTFWATCNVGANSPEESGNFYSWGEIATKSNYAWSTYTYGTSSTGKLSKYNSTDSLVVLEEVDDVARANWGIPGRMPTKDELDELVKNCTWTWTTRNGVNGYTVTSKYPGNTNSIFLPAGGTYTNSPQNVGVNARYWSSSLYRTDLPHHAYHLFIKSGEKTVTTEERYAGFSVRPVRTTKFSISVTSGKGGSIIGAGLHPAGSTVTIEAIPDEGYVFVGWGDDNGESPRDIVMDYGHIVIDTPFEPIGSTFTYNGLNYTILDATTVEVGVNTDFVGENLVIPAIAKHIKGKEFNVVGIGDGAFEGCAGLTGNITIPEAVTYVGKSAFANCSGITGTINFQNFQSIGSSAFKGCAALTGTLTLNASLEALSDSVFYGCSSLTGELIIPTTITTINQHAFNGCAGLTGSLDLSHITSINTYAFNGCSGFTGTLTLHPSLKTLGSYAFYNCTGLTGELIIPATITTINTYTFRNCKGFNKLTFAEGTKLTTINSYAFYDCSGLKGDLTIPNTVTTIATYAFYGCSGFDGRLTLPTNSKFTTIKAYTFMNCSTFVGDLVIPNSVTSIEQQAFRYCSGFNGTLTLSTAIKTIGNFAFQSCTGFTGDLTIPNTVTTSTGIGQQAFQSCTGMKGTLTLSNDPSTTSNDRTFASSGFTRVIVPEGVETIGKRAFEKCTSLKQIFLPSTLTNLNQYSLDGCKNLAAITCDAVNPPTVGTNVFRNVPKTIPVYVPSEESVALYEVATGWKDFFGYIQTLPFIEVSEDTYLSELQANYTSLENIDVSVINGATLTCDVSGTVANLTIQEGAILYVQDGNALTVSSNLVTQSKDDVQPQILTVGTGAITYGDFAFVKNIPADRYYFFALPFASNTDAVTINEETTGEATSAVYNTDWNYLYYDGAAFAQNPSNESFWYTADAGAIAPNQGYAVGVDASSPEAYRELTFTASGTVDFGISGTRTVAVTENPLKEGYAHPDKETFKGWNFILNPYTSNFTGTMTLPGISEADVYVSIPKAGQNQTYTQCRLSDLTASGWGAIPPFYGFFVQVGKSGNVTFSPKAKSGAPRKAQAAQPYTAIGVTLSNGTAADVTTLVIGEQYTDNYEIGSDLMKMIGYGNKPQVYTYHGSTKYAFKSVNEASAAQAQPMGVYLPAAGTYTFSLRDSETAAQTVYLYDYETNTTTNLVESDYTFTCGKLNSEKRFAISATLAKAPSITTSTVGTEEAMLEVWQDGALNVRIEGVQAGAAIRIINLQGQVVSQTTAMDTFSTCSVPQNGLYIVEVTNATSVQVQKIIVE